MNKTYQRNLETLSKVGTETHRWLLKGNPDQRIRVENNLHVVRPDGTRYAYYPEEPSIPSEIRNISSMDLSSGTLTCLIGMGLGYTAKAILETMETGHILMVIEPNPHIVKLALERFDFSHALLSNGLFILLPDGTVIQKQLLNLMGGGFVHKDIHVIPDPRSIALFPEYGNWVADVQQAFKQATLIISGETGAAKLFILNEFENIIQVALSPSIEKLTTFIAGRPILITGAGPSLDHSLEWIKRLGEKVVIMALSASFRILLFHGITPHLVVAGDKNIESLGMIKNTTHAQDCPLVCSSRVHPDFLKAYTGSRFMVLDAGPVGAWLSSSLENVVSLHTGLNVASFALQVADYFKGDPIILTGMDLAAGEYSHVTGHPHRSKVGDEPTAIRVEGVRGSMVKTFPSWCVIREGIEEQIRAMGRPVINATAAGARIRHTKEATLEELDKKYFGMKPIPGYDTSFSPVLFHDHIKPLSEELIAFIDEAEKCLIICKKGIEASKAYARSFGKSEPEKERLQHTINHHTAAIEQFMGQYPFLKLYMGDVLLRAKVANARIDRESDAKARFKLEVEKNQQALEAFKKDIRALVAGIRSKIHDLKELYGILSELRDSRSELDFLRLASFLYKRHFYMEAADGIKKALSIRMDFPEAKILLAKIFIRRRCFAEARSLIDTYMARQGRSEEGEQLLAEIGLMAQQLNEDMEEAGRQKDVLGEKLLSKELEHTRSISLSPDNSRIL